MTQSISWQWITFSEFKLIELYAVLSLRQTVFIVEQNCIYQDCDGLDQVSWHLMGWVQKDKSPILAAYLRVVLPGHKYSELSIGRVITAPDFRGTGLGRTLIKEALQQIEITFGRAPIRISAQEHLRKFYEDHGFTKTKGPYLEDGIPHIEMLR